MKVTDIPKALTDPKRYLIIELLLIKPHTVESIAAVLGLPGQLSADFKKLLKAGIIDFDKKGHHRLYKVRKDVKKPMRGILKLIESIVAKGTDNVKTETEGSDRRAA